MATRAHEAGIALGVRFHGVSFTYTAATEYAAQVALVGAPSVASAIAAGEGAPGATAAPVRVAAARPGALSLTPQQLDKLADQFRTQTPQSTAALLAILEMQTRQNIAEALAASGQLIVVTPQELGLAGATVQGQVLSRVTQRAQRGGEACASGLRNQPPCCHEKTHAGHSARGRGS